MENNNHPPKDLWDKVGIIASIVTPLIAIMITYVYNKQQNELQKIEVLDKCAQYLKSSDTTDRQFGYLFMKTLGHEDLANEYFKNTKDTVGYRVINGNSNVSFYNDSNFLTKKDFTKILEKDYDIISKSKLFEQQRNYIRSLTDSFYKTNNIEYGLQLVSKISSFDEPEVINLKNINSILKNAKAKYDIRDFFSIANLFGKFQPDYTTELCNKILDENEKLNQDTLDLIIFYFSMNNFQLHYPRIVSYILRSSNVLSTYEMLLYNMMLNCDLFNERKIVDKLESEDLLGAFYVRYYPKVNYMGPHPDCYNNSYLENRVLKYKTNAVK